MKMLPGIVVTILIIALGWFLISPFWFWVSFEIVAALFVAVGCSGEWWLHHHPAGRKKREKDEHHKLESRFISVVALGVIMELFSLGHSIKEGKELGEKAEQAKKEASQANERASTNELVSKQLEIRLNETKTQLANAEARLNESVVELKNNSLPMDIGEQYSFANTLKPLLGIQVELRSAVDSKAQQTAELLFSTFAMGGWPVINRAFIGDLGESGIVIGFGASDSSKNAAYLLLKILTERSVPAKIIDDPMGDRVRGVPTNAIIVAVCQRPSQLKANLMLVEAKQAELRNQEPKIWPRIMELVTNRYVVGSKELATAQAEYNDLNSQMDKIRSEQDALFAQERKLDDQIEKEYFGTNAMTPGIHMNNSSFSGNIIPFAVAGTNSPRIFMHGTRINPQPLQ
jgi:predicted nuclease with TOPRIM domain